MSTWGLHELLVQSESDEWLFQLPEEVFEETTYHMDVLDLLKHKWSFTLQEGLSQLLHQTFSSRNPVQTFLHKTHFCDQNYTFYSHLSCPLTWFRALLFCHWWPFVYVCVCVCTPQSGPSSRSQQYTLPSALEFWDDLQEQNLPPISK